MVDPEATAAFDEAEGLAEVEATGGRCLNEGTTGLGGRLEIPEEEEDGTGLAILEMTLGGPLVDEVAKRLGSGATLSFVLVELASFLFFDASSSAFGEIEKERGSAIKEFQRNKSGRSVNTKTRLTLTFLSLSSLSFRFLSSSATFAFLSASSAFLNRFSSSALAFSSSLFLTSALFFLASASRAMAAFRSLRPCSFFAASAARARALTGSGLLFFPRALAAKEAP